MFLLSEFLWEIELIKAIQLGSNGFFDFLFKAITQLGTEMVFIVIAAVLYWCYNKKYAYGFMFCYFGSVLTVSGIKPLVGRLRPFEAGAVSIGEETHGFSFPSGHSQSAAALGSQLARKFGSKKRWWVIAVATVLVLLVMFSRMYLGQHYLTDVLTGAAIGVAVPWALSYVFAAMGDKEQWFCLLALPVFLVLMLVLEGDYEKLKDLYVAAGAFTGVSIGYIIEKRYIKQEVKAKFYVYLIRVAAGLAIALAIKEGFKLFLPDENLWADLFRYAMMGLWASAGLFASEKLVYKICAKVKAGNSPNDDSEKQ